MDRWALSELQLTVRTVTERLDAYDVTAAGRAIGEFVDELSNWYVRRSRRRFWKGEDDRDKKAAHSTLYECLVTVTKLTAPFTPFVAEALYQNLVADWRGAGERAPRRLARVRGRAGRPRPLGADVRGEARGRTRAGRPQRRRHKDPPTLEGSRRRRRDL